MQTVAVIGAGSIGGALARMIGELGYDVRLANSRGPETLADFDAPGVTPAWAADAAHGADAALVVLSQDAVANLSTAVRDALASVPIVIDVGNYYPVRDGRIPAIDSGLPDSGWVAEQLGRPVFKAFNNIGVMSLLTKAKPRGSIDRVALSVAGRAGAEKAQVMELVDRLGFDPVDGGEIEASWRQQPGTAAYCRDLPADDLARAIADADEAEIPTYHANRDAQDAIGGMAKQRRLIAHGKFIEPPTP